ncbi:MAG: hypothetical protein HYY44_01725 [Deltaproteobacteria bacterium]|nr:hypothetical protein [Deltaproteobacteria bacterium]
MKDSNKGNSKSRVYQNGEMVLTEEEFQQVVEVFKTLLEWDKDLKQSKEKQESKPLPEKV